MAATKTTRKTLTATANIDAAKVARDKAYREDLIDGAHAHLGYAYNTVRKFTNDDIIGAYAAEGFVESGMLDALSGRMGYPMSSITPLCLPALVQLWLDTIQADPKALAEAKAEEAAEKAEEAATEATAATPARKPVDNTLVQQRRDFLVEAIKAGRFTEDELYWQLNKAFPTTDHGITWGLVQAVQNPKNRAFPGLYAIKDEADGTLSLASR